MLVRHRAVEPEGAYGEAPTHGVDLARVSSHHLEAGLLRDLGERRMCAYTVSLHRVIGDDHHGVTAGAQHPPHLRSRSLEVGEEAREPRKSTVAANGSGDEATELAPLVEPLFAALRPDVPDADVLLSTGDVLGRAAIHPAYGEAVCSGVVDSVEVGRRRDDERLALGLDLRGFHARVVWAYHLRRGVQGRQDAGVRVQLPQQGEAVDGSVEPAVVRLEHPRDPEPLDDTVRTRVVHVHRVAQGVRPLCDDRSRQAYERHLLHVVVRRPMCLRSDGGE
jgi:hypothetical protein